MNQLGGGRSARSPAQLARLQARLQTVGEGADRDRIPRRTTGDTAPLSFPQQRLWFMAQLMPGSAMHHIPFGFKVPGPLDAAAVQAALDEIVRRHESLRTVFELRDGEPVQRVLPELRLTVERIDLSDRPAAERDALARQRADSLALEPFDLGRGPLLRVALIRLAPQDHLFVMSLHHIVADGWSMGLLANELTVLYAAALARRASPLPELPIQYADFAVWQHQWLRDATLARQLSYWTTQLGGLPAFELRSDHPRPPVQTFRGAQHQLQLAQDVVTPLRELGRSEGATLFMVLLTVFCALLQRHSRQDDIVVGSFIAGRNRQEVEQLIGFFLNTLVLRVDLSGEPDVREALRRVRRIALAAYENQDLPFEKLVERLQPQRDLSRNPLCQVAFQLQNASALTSGGASADAVPGLAIARHTSVFDLSVTAWETPGDGLGLHFEYSTDLFEAGSIERFATHFRCLLESAARQPESSIARLPMMPIEERRLLLHDWSGTAKERDGNIGVLDLLAERVRAHPERDAFRCDTARIGYAELDRRSNQLAHYLTQAGVGRGQVVALCLERSIDSAIALLAILKVGAVYLPLDPGYPVARLNFMLDDAGASALLTDAAHAVGFSHPPACVIRIDAERALIDALATSAPVTAVEADDLAYIVYTSGSTGRPKGIASPHRQLLDRLWWMWESHPFAEGEVACHKTALSFVDSLWELLGGLLQGVPTAIIPDPVLRDPPRLVDELARCRVTRLWLVPSLLDTLLFTVPDLGRRLPELRFWVSSGEALSRDLLQRFRQAHPTATLYNLYGTSEAWDSTWCAPDPGAPGAQAVPIGKPIDNVAVYVIEPGGEPAPVGVAGELCTGGAGLAAGYLNQPELSAAAFIANPFPSTFCRRLYKTGDLARWRPDGQLEYLGRIDQTLKLRGHRVEPAEIEAALRAHPAIAQAVVVARPGPHGALELAAYCTCWDQQRPSRKDVHAFLRRSLPESMLPATLGFLDALPLTPSGKVNRLALPDPQPDPSPSTREEAASGPIESGLLQIWRELLGREDIGRHQDFFSELGGHSLLAMRMGSRVRDRFKVDLPMLSFFEAPTIAALAERIAATAPLDDAARPALKPAARERYRV